jgi:hypothetical protein
MAKQTINIGTVANDGTGDDLRVAMQKVNDNFTELYTASPLTSQISIEGNHIYTNSSNANLKLSAAGTGAVELEGIQIQDNHIEATRSNDDLILSASGTGDIVAGAVRIHGTTISSDDSTKITFNEAVDITGAVVLGTSLTLASGATVTAILDEDTMTSDSATALATQQSIKAYVDSQIGSSNTLTIADDSSTTSAINLDNTVQFLGGNNISTTVSGSTVTIAGDTAINVNSISSSDSSAIQINDGVNISGTLSANTIDTNTISSGDSTAVTFSDNVNINGTLTATLITGVTSLTHGQVSDGTATTATSAQTSIDTTASATYRSIRYEVSVSDSTNSRYALVNVYITHNGSNAYINTNSVSSTGSDLGTFDADISGGNVRLLVTPATSDSVTYKFVKTAIAV